MTNAPPTRSRLGWVVALTSTAYFMVVLDALVVVTALPRMQRDLHVGLSSLQWTVNAYRIAFAACIISAAALGDRPAVGSSSRAAWRCSRSRRRSRPTRASSSRLAPSRGSGPRSYCRSA